MDKGISNIKLEKFFNDKQKEDLKKNYMGVYSMDSITRYKDFYEIIKKRNVKCPFAILNTDRHNEPRTHWWSFMDIHPPKKIIIMLIDSLAFDVF